MYVRYEQTHGGKRYGLMMGGYDLSRLSDAEQTEFYAHPLQLPSPDLCRRDLVFAFTLDGEARHARMIELRSRAALGRVERVLLDPTDWSVVWTDGDQVALYSTKHP